MDAYFVPQRMSDSVSNAFTISGAERKKILPQFRLCRLKLLPLRCAFRTNENSVDERRRPASRVLDDVVDCCLLKANVCATTFGVLAGPAIAPPNHLSLQH